LLKVQELRELIKLLDQSTIDELVYEEKDCKIKLKKTKQEGGQVSSTVMATPPQQIEEKKPSEPIQKQEVVKETTPPANETNTTDSSLHKIVSPMVGTYYASPSPEDAIYVKVGDKVTTDSVVCIVEAMKLFNEIEAEVKGEIIDVLVENGQLVEYGQPLFLVKPE
jgi:acetyl-CoA carboxylase biotin carboxyl carrier protein